MTTITAGRSSSFAGVPVSSWAFGIRIWMAVVVALAASFWLDLEAPASAAITVGILAEPTRGRALDKACFRLIATIIGVTAAIVITALFSQARDLMLAAFAVWIGLCVYAAGLLDGNRAYAAVLSGYSVAIVAIQQLDAPDRVFEAGMERGCAIAVGIAAIAVANDLLAAPHGHPQLEPRLVALHRRVRDYAKAVFRDAATDLATAAALLGDIASLRPEMASLAADSSSGPSRSAAARSAAVSLVAEVHAIRVLDAVAAVTGPTGRDAIASALDWRDGAAPALPPSSSAPAAQALLEVLRRDDEVSDAIAALQSGTRPRRAWRTPLQRSHRTAAVAGIRAALCLALASLFFVLAGWPSADVSLALVAIFIGLGATSPNPEGFTVTALAAAPIVAVLAGTLEFLILDGVTEFPLLALALAPFVIGAAVAKTSPHPFVAALGRLNLIYILVVLAPSNPQSYDPNAFLFTALFLCAAPAVLLAAQLLVPPVSGKRHQSWLLASARRELDHAPSRRDRRWAPEEAMFRDAVRIGRFTGATSPGPQHRTVLREALSCFDQAAAIRLCHACLARLARGAGSDALAAARAALSARDPRRIHEAARAVAVTEAAEDADMRATRDALVFAGMVVDAARRPLELRMERTA